MGVYRLQNVDFLQNLESDIVYVELHELGTEIEKFGEVGTFEGD